MNCLDVSHLVNVTRWPKPALVKFYDTALLRIDSRGMGFLFIGGWAFTFIHKRVCAYLWSDI